MIIKTKRVDSKHVIVLDIPTVDGQAPDRHDAPALDPNWINSWNMQIYLAKRLANGGLSPIPDEEPVILFRGRDHLALQILQVYRNLCVYDGCNDYQLESMDSIIRSFEEFKKTHPEVMKQPGLTRGM